MKSILSFATVILCFLCFTVLSCEKNASTGKARLQVFLTDDPGDYQEVHIDVKEVMINVTGDTVNGWQSLPGVQAGVYDLLKLVNDDDTLLVNAEIPAGRLHQIRLVLGTENFVKVDNQLIRLETPSAQQSGLKLNIQHDIEEGLLYTITMDFDVAKSIKQTGNGRYMLKPVIRTILEAAGGSLKGFVVPGSFQTGIYAVQGSDTVASTFTDTNGGYLLRGLSTGSYDLHFDPTNVLYRDTIRTGINVTNAQVTRVDTMFLRQ